MIIDFDKIEETINPHFKGGEKEMAARTYLDDMNRIMRGRLIPGATIGYHSHDTSSEVMFFTAGEGYVQYDGQRLPIHAGLCHYCPKGHSHGVVNTSPDRDLEYYAVVPQQ